MIGYLNLIHENYVTDKNNKQNQKIPLSSDKKNLYKPQEYVNVNM